MANGEIVLTFLDRNNHFNKQSDKMIYLSNLPYEMTWMELKDILREKAGEVCLKEISSTKEA